MKLSPVGWFQGYDRALSLLLLFVRSVPPSISNTSLIMARPNPGLSHRIDGDDCSSPDECAI